MYIVIDSKIPQNYGEKIKVEVSEDDLVSDIIRRVCVLMTIESEPRMYLRLENGFESGGNDVATQYLE